MSKSCCGCKWMYFKDEGYSNYTVTETFVECALDANPKLPAEYPYDWSYGPHCAAAKNAEAQDNWPYTQNARCDRWEQVVGQHVHLDVDNEVRILEATDDPVLAAVLLLRLKRMDEI